MDRLDLAQNKKNFMRSAQQDRIPTHTESTIVYFMGHSERTALRCRSADHKY